MKLKSIKTCKKWNAGFSLIEATVAMSLLIVSSQILMRENLTLIRDKRWSVRVILCRGLLAFHEVQARAADRQLIDPANANSANPWLASPDTATPLKVTIGNWPGGNNPIYSYLTRSSEVSDDGEYREIRLQQSVTFRSGNKYYQMLSTINR